MANARATVGRLGTRLLARVEWIDERPAARLAHSIRERHWPATHPTRPRLMPQADSARAEPTRMERDGDAGAGTPARPPGMSAFAARWLFGDGEVEGTPFAGGAAVPAERAGQIPSFLVARKPSAADPEPTPPPRATKPRRGRLVEGQPVRISALPPMTTPELPDTPTPPEPTGAAIARDDAPGDAHVPATPGPSTVARDPRPEPDTPEEGGTHAAQPRPQAPRPAPAPVRLRAVPNLVAAPPRLEPVRIARRLEPEARAEQGSGAVVAGAPPEGPAPAAPSPLRAALNRVATAVRRRPATGHVRHETASTGAVPRASATPTPVPRSSPMPHPQSRRRPAQCSRRLRRRLRRSARRQSNRRSQCTDWRVHCCTCEPRRSKTRNNLGCHPPPRDTESRARPSLLLHGSRAVRSRRSSFPRQGPRPSRSCRRRWSRVCRRRKPSMPHRRLLSPTRRPRADRVPPAAGRTPALRLTPTICTSTCSNGCGATCCSSVSGWAISSETCRDTVGRWPILDARSGRRASLHGRATRSHDRQLLRVQRPVGGI